MGIRRRTLGDMVSEDQLAAYVHAAFAAVADELIEFGPTKSGHVMIHFRLGVPLQTEWRLKAESVSRSMERSEE